MIILSIITVAYNDLLGLRSTIESIDKIFDSYEALGIVEHVIVDGNSTDGTIDYLHKMSGGRKIKTKYKSEPDKGIYDAMNKGVGQSSGQFVVFLNSGDEIFAGVDTRELITNLKHTIYSLNEAGLAFSSIIKFAGRSFKINSREVQNLSPRMPTIHQSMFFKRNVLLDFQFDSSYRVCGDYDNFARIFTSGLVFRTCDDIFSVFYAGGVSSKSPIKLFLESSGITKKHFNLKAHRRILIMTRLFISLAKVQLLLLVYKEPKHV